MQEEHDLLRCSLPERNGGASVPPFVCGTSTSGVPREMLRRLQYVALET